MRTWGKYWWGVRYGIFVGVLLLGYFLRIHELFTMPRGIHNDEATNILWAWRWSAGYGMPYFFDSRPEPFDALIRSVWAWFVGLSPFGQRMFHLSLSTIGIAASAAAAKALYRHHRYVSLSALISSVVLAVIPAYVIINRSIYRANWVVPMALLAITFTLHAQRTNRIRHATLAGIFTGLTGLFYLSGLSFIPAFIGTMLVSMVLSGKPIQRRMVFAYLAALFVTMLPWLTLYLTIPNWLGGRVDALKPINPIQQPLQAVEAYVQALLPIVRVDVTETENIRYNTWTSSFLNPALLVFAVLGLAGSLWNWRKPHQLTPIIIGAFFVLPSALSGNTQVVIRTIGLFSALALLAGYGSAFLTGILTQYVPKGKYLAYGVILLVIIGSAVFTYASLQYHYKVNPVLHDNPRQRHSIAAQYHLGYYDFAQYVIHNDMPMYIPVGFLNENASALLRPVAYPTVRGYDGRALPSGEIVMPEQHISDFPPIGYPVDYALFLPDTQEIMLLPPLEREAAVELFDQIEQTGEPLMSIGDWRIGFRRSLPDPTSVFSNENLPDITQTLATFDNYLELVAVVAPHDLIRGIQVNPITLFWRLHEPTSTDYHVVIQPYTLDNEAMGIGEMWMYHWFFPSPMWQSGDVIPFTLWVNVYEDAPAGAYRFLIGVYTKPYNEFVYAAPQAGYAQSFLEGQRIIAGHAEIEVDNLFEPPPANAVDIGALFDNRIMLEQTSSAIENQMLLVNLYWYVLQTPPVDYTIFLHLFDANENLVAQQDIQPFNGRYPTGHWSIHERYTTTHAVSLPDDIQCPCTLYSGMYANHNLERLTVTQNGTGVLDNRVPIVLPDELR